MFKISGIAHWAIGVDNLDQAEQFYRDLLGLECLGRLSGNDMSAFKVGDQSLLLCERREPLHRTQEQEHPLHFAFEVEAEEWDKAARTLWERGISPYGPVMYRPEGFFPSRQLFVLDPSGNRLEFTDLSWKPGMPTPTFEEIVGAKEPAHRG